MRRALAAGSESSTKIRTRRIFTIFLGNWFNWEDSVDFSSAEKVRLAQLTLSFALCRWCRFARMCVNPSSLPLVHDRLQAAHRFWSIISPTDQSGGWRCQTLFDTTS
ncbi:MAG: hypothetical protein NT069_20245 [Planctomycetota bacterium]|nr:hypothetical protein [Planctomycetota bacterium]